MSICAVFLDGAYIDKVVQSNHDRAPIDYYKLAQTMAGDNELLRAYYYNCLPYQHEPPSAEERERFSGRYRFYEALEHLPRFQVNLGKLTLLGQNADGRNIVQQKRVDIMLAIDMINLAIKGRVSSISVFTGDSDFIPAFEKVKAEGVRTVLWHGDFAGDNSAPSRELYKLADERVCLTGDLVKTMLRETADTRR